MSTSQIFGVVGAAVGAYFGGPEGARWGYMIGSAIGTIVDPEVIKGPRLGDAMQQTASAGIPRPIIYGLCAVRGNIIDVGELRKRKQREEQGKGGPVLETERWIRTYAIRICEGPVAGVRRIWRDGKLVYDISDLAQRPEVGGDGWAALVYSRNAFTTSWGEKMRLYLGDETQMPDPALEAIHGVGSTPAYRGTCYMVIEDDDLTERGGAIPDYQFEVVSQGTVTTLTNNLLSGTASSLGYVGGFSSGYTQYVQYSAFPDIGAPVVRLNNFLIDRIARIRIVPLYGTVTNLQRPALDEDRDVLTRGVAYDSGWWAANETVADIFRAVQPGVGISIGTPSAEILRLDRTFTGLFIFVEQYQDGYSIARLDAEFCDYGGPATLEHLPDVAGALLGSDGQLYWPPWTTSQATSTVSADMIAVADIVADVCDRVGIPASSLDLTLLAGMQTRGYPLGRQMSAADAIRGLQLPYMFDMPEFDGKLRAVPRGGPVVATVTEDDMVDGDGEEVVRKQSMEFPRKLSVTAPDPSANHQPMTQTASRRSLRVQAESEAAVQLALTLLPDENAQIADTQLKISWSNAEGEIEIRLPDQWSRLVPSDPIEFRSKRWVIYEREQADGAILFRARYDRASDYQSSASGSFSVQRPAYQSPRGPSRLQVLNLPVLRETDDEVGVYIAAGGVLPGWAGCQVHVSEDGFQTFDTVATVVDGAAIGTNTTALTAETPGFPSAQTITVTLPRAPEALEYEDLLRYRNLLLVGNELMQFEDVVDLGSNTYRLEGLLRGTFDTDAPAHVVGERVVLIDSAVFFVPIPRSKIGSTFQLRAVSSQTLADASPVVPFEFATCVSQTEWPVRMIETTRDAGNQVTVTWLGRPRLGTETAPFHSKYFSGYRVDFSNGYTVTTTGTSILYAGAPGTGVPAGVTVTVTPINSITGDGPTSEAIPT